MAKDEESTALFRAIARSAAAARLRAEPMQRRNREIQQHDRERRARLEAMPKPGEGGSKDL